MISSDSHAGPRPESRLPKVPSRWPAIAVFAVVAVAYASASAVALSWFGALGIGLPVFFPAAGVTLGALIVVGRRRWPVVLAAAGVAELVADVAHGLNVAAALGFAVANTVEPLVGAVLLQSGRRPVDLGRRGGLARFLAGPTLVAPLVGAVIGATSQALFMAPTAWLDAALRWWVGDSLGVLVVGGVVLACLSDSAVETARSRVAEAVTLLAATCAVVATALWAQAFALLYGVVLLLVWAAFRVGVLGVALAGTCVAVLTARATATQENLLPELGFAPAASLLYVQLLIIVVIATMMAFAVEVGEREQTLRRFTAAAAAAMAERAAHRQSDLLSGVTAALAHATTIDDAIEALHAHGLVPMGASGSSVGVLAGDGAFRVVTRGFPSGISERFASVPVDAPLPGPATIRDGRARFLATRSETRQLFPAAADVLDETDFTAAAVLPLRRAGTTIGYLGAHFAGEREFTHADRMLLEAIAVQVSHTLERAQLYETAVALRELAEHRARREQLRNDITTRLAAAAEEKDQLQSLVDALVPAMADFATVEIPTPEGPPRLIALSHSDPARAEDLRRLRQRYALSPDEPNAVARTLATGETRIVERIDQDMIERFTVDPAARALLTSLAPCSSAAVPLSIAGTVIGALLLGYAASGRHYGADDAEFLQSLAAKAALAVENARLHRTAHRVAETLQRSLLPAALPVLDRLGLAVRYLPAAEGTRAGGDWYDVLDLDPHTVAVVVGDVVGHGPAAAAVMGQLRSALTAYLLQDHSPARALGWLTRFARRVPDAPASTAIAVVIDTDTGELRWARAGHPPPLVITPLHDPAVTSHDEWPVAVTYLDDAQGAVLGIRNPPPFTEGRTVLAPGASLLLYTDGLVERRGEAIDEGLDRLAAAVAGTDAAPTMMIERVLHRALGGTDPNDDVALIVARFRPAPLQLRLPALPEQLVAVRRAVSAWAESAVLPHELTDDLQLALGEAVANAVEHAYPSGAPGEVRISVRDQDDRVVVSVTDDGAWRPPPADPGYRGRGLALIHALGLDVTVATTGPGTGIGFALSVPSRPVSPAPSRPRVPHQLLADGAVPVAAAARLHVREDDGGSIHVELSGDLDLAALPALRSALIEQLRAHLARGPRDIVLDLRELGYLSSAGVGLIVEAARLAPTRPRLILRPGTPAARIVALTGLDNILLAEPEGDSPPAETVPQLDRS